MPLAQLKNLAVCCPRFSGAFSDKLNKPCFATDNTGIDVIGNVNSKVDIRLLVGYNAGHMQSKRGFDHLGKSRVKSSFETSNNPTQALPALSESDIESGKNSARCLESLPLPNLELLTFTGIDVLSRMPAVYRIKKQYPKVEFGILVGSHSGEMGYNRFPALATIDRWREFSQKWGVQMAIHLCGKFARGVIDGTGLEEALSLCEGFGRVQINASTYDYGQINIFADGVSCSKVILQKREAFDQGYPLVHPKVEYLFDLSGGTGKEGFNHWPLPSDTSIRSGYAGGLQLSNIDQALTFLRAAPEYAAWLDMESGVRTPGDWLDLTQVEAICQTVFSS